MPIDGKLQRMIHVPGRLFSVAPYTVRQVPNLFARNERVVSLFETTHGPMAVVLVGAMLVSSMETVWSGLVTPPRGRKISRRDWSRRDIELKKGQEMGRFNMGSTVILLLPPGAVAAIDRLRKRRRRGGRAEACRASSDRLLPPALTSLVLFIQPGLQRREIIEHRRRIHLR